ncbi:MAG: S9 family peptidase [Bacteroidales bacterium]|nr:S9 family peptidase [Bacteroidales bacterium]MCF8389436.1 S9 family peptidase [Bacteroidales bacterium]
MKNYLWSGLVSILFIFTACTNTPETDGIVSDFSGALTETEISNAVLTPEILWKFGRISDHQLSPDATTIIYGVTRYDAKTNKSHSDIFSMPAKGGEKVKLTDAEHSAFNQRWKPDGTKIGFLSAESGETQLWEMNPDGTSKIMISNIEGGINGFEYSPECGKILYLKDVKLDQTANDIYTDLPLANARIIDDLMYRHWNSWHDYSYSHIFIAEIKDGKLLPGNDIMIDEPWDAPLSPYFDQAEICWSPDGTKIAYTCKKMKGKDFAISTNSDIYLYDLELAETENITKGMNGYDKYPSFSNDGKKIAWQSMKTPGFEADKNRLFVMDLETGKKEYLTPEFDQDAEHLVWSADDKSIYFITGIEATYQLAVIDIATREVKQITEGNHNYTNFHLGDGFISGEKMSMSMATEIFSVDLATAEEEQLSFENKNIYEAIEFGNFEERWVTTTDNKKMKVWVIYPPDFDPAKKYPALLYCQGGPQSAVSQFFSFRWNFQIMAANDYIIVAPNRRGLPTFGSEWNEQISGDYGGQNIKDYLSAIDDVAKEDYVDADRLGAIGASYGGYSVFYLAGHHEGRFKTFISHCGIYNFESMYASTEEMFFVNHDVGGAYWDVPKPKSYKFSPHLYVNKWDTPIMIITGENDFRIPYTESLQAFNAAQLRGIPSKLLIFPEETHFVVKPQNSILWQREFFGWLDSYLK